MTVSAIIAIISCSALLIVLFVIFIGSIISTHIKMNDPNSYITEAEDDLVEEASVVNKDYGVEQTGSTKFPSHRRIYMITFLLNDTTEKSLNVGGENYEKIEIEEKGLLITQNGNFLGFDKK